MTAAAITLNSQSLSHGTLEHLDPQTLMLEDNVRSDVAGAAFADLVASVREFGILSALSAVRNAHGEVTVRDGQRRLLAAREAGLASVPVYVTVDATTGQARTITRITEQIVANDHRAPLTTTERAKGIQQLLLEGLTPAKVAKSLTVPKTVVEAAAITACSEQAMAALSATQLTIEQAAVLADFDHDPQAVQYLTEAPSAGDFDHRVSELRQKAVSAAARNAALEPFRSRGYGILDERVVWSSELSRARLDRLYDTNGKRASSELPDQQPQLWAIWLNECEVYCDTRTGEEVDEGDIDWDVDAADHDAVPDEGYVHPRFVEQRNIFEPEFYCVDLEAAGLQTYQQYYDSAARGGNRSEDSGQDAEARKESERREKRKVVALNRLGLAAIDVRRAWVKDALLARKTPPAGAALFIAAQLAEHPSLLTLPSAAPVAAELLGIGGGNTIAGSVAALPSTGDARAVVMTLGLLLGALEAETPKDAWRRTYTSHGKNYLMFLSDNGYQLSDIEKVITGKIKADTLYDRVAAEKAAASRAG